MMYEFYKYRRAIGHKKAICVFCKQSVSWGDYAYLCKEHGDNYYKIPEFFRTILPKIFIAILVNEKIKIGISSTYGLFLLFPAIGIIKTKNNFVISIDWMYKGVYLYIGFNKRRQER